jgi:hypothetical protein
VCLNFGCCCRWLKECGFECGHYKRGIYTDGHEQPDNLAYRQEVYIPFLRGIEKWTTRYSGKECEEGIPPELEGAEAEVVIYFHDECCFKSNDDYCKQWYVQGKPLLKKKSEGASHMVSSFVGCKRGELEFSPQEHEQYKLLNPGKPLPATARVCIDPGKNADGYWNNEMMMAQLGTAVDIFEQLHPSCIGLWVFDHSTGHSANAADALNAANLGVKPGGKSKAVTMKEGEQDGMPLSMVFQEGDTWLFDWHCTEKGFSEQGQSYKGGDRVPEVWWGRVKGIQHSLMERGLWSPEVKKLKLKCKKEEEHIGDSCCKTRLLSRQPDFLRQKPAVVEYLESRGHLCLLLPKYHCELNWIERWWGLAKQHTRKYCDYTFPGLKQQVPIALSDSNKCLNQPLLTLMRKWDRLGWRYVDVYEKGFPSDVAQKAAQKYHGHRQVSEALDAKLWAQLELGKHLGTARQAASAPSAPAAAAPVAEAEAPV